jgi:hypothetical protein
MKICPGMARKPRIEQARATGVWLGQLSGPVAPAVALLIQLHRVFRVAGGQGKGKFQAFICYQTQKTWAGAATCPRLTGILRCASLAAPWTPSGWGRSWGKSIKRLLSNRIQAQMNQVNAAGAQISKAAEQAFCQIHTVPVCFHMGKNAPRRGIL